MAIKAKVNGKNVVYGSIAEAARALGVDASNIGKVLRGLRATAGGISFERTDKAPTTPAAKAAAKAQKKRDARSDLINAVHDRLQDINERYFDAVREERKGYHQLTGKALSFQKAEEIVFSDDPILLKMMSHRNYFGMTQRGGYFISDRKLREFSDDELKNLLGMLKVEEKQYTRVAEANPKVSNAAQLALLFNTGKKQIHKYKDVLPILFNLVHLAKMDSFFRYSDVQENLYYLLEKNASPEDVEKFVDLLFEAYEGNDDTARDQILFEMEQYSKDPAFRDEYHEHHKYD